MTLTKTEIVNRICEKAHASTDDAFNFIECTLKVIKASLEHGEPVRIACFGSFVVRTKAPRKVRHPHTGAEIVIPEHKVLTFKASKVMRKAVEQTPADLTTKLLGEIRQTAGAHLIT
jgi:nucleoid DNA-binding protein